MDLMAELRQKLTLSPSAHHFLHILYLFLMTSEINEEEQAMALDYAEQHLAHWPDSVRILHNKKQQNLRNHHEYCTYNIQGPDWPANLRYILSGDNGPHPCLSLVRTLKLGEYDLKEGLWEAFASSQHLTNLTTLSLYEPGCTLDELRTVLNSPRLAKLRELSIKMSYSAEKFGKVNTIANLLSNQNALDSLQVLRLVYCSTREEGVEAIFKSPNLTSLKELHVNATVSQQAVDALADSPNPRRFTALTSYVPYQVETPATVLANAEVLSSLKKLSLFDSQSGTRPLGILLKSEHFNQLTHLDLSYTELNESGAKVIFPEAKALSKVKSLVLKGNFIDEEGMEALVNSPHIKSLQALHLESNHIRDRGLIALANSPSSQHIKRLNLENCGITDKGLDALTQSPHLTQLEELILTNNYVTDDGCQRFINSPNASKLKKLVLRDTGAGVQTVKALANASDMTHLQELIFFRNAIGDKGVIAMANAPHLASLIHLNLEECKVGDKGAVAIARSPHLSNLQTLSLKGGLGDGSAGVDGVSAFVQSECLPNLRVLIIDGVEYGSENHKALEAKALKWPSDYNEWMVF